ncbi:MAG: DUF455 family protein [Verrucomicrobiales bacterium]|nr:DUF455 family protein [Verrucomicrobiales bacterium]
MIHVHPNLQEVEQASALQRRLYRTIRETLRAMAGRLTGVAGWEAKKLLAHDVWLDAEHANGIRQRVLELRFPRVDVEVDLDHALLAVLDHLPSTQSDAEFLAGVYRVVKPEVLAAVERYLEQSDPLDDAPSHRGLRWVRDELREQLQQFASLWATVPPAEQAAAQPWEDWVRAALAEAGGVFGQDSGRPRLSRPGFSDRPRYEIPPEPQRDPRWLPAVTQVPPRPPRTPQEQQIWVAIDHMNEIWASELAGALMWHHRGLPWSLYYDAARWTYDEMRHAMMGERRLLAYGFDPGVDVPIVPDHWRGVGGRGGLEAMLFVVHGLEQGGPQWKAQLRSELWQLGDPYSAQDCDYDWADESGHIRYGQEWIQALYPDVPKARLIERTRQEVDAWKEWIAEKHRTGRHGYEAYLERIETKCSQMPVPPRPEFFRPLGSSAATASYATPDPTPAS